MNSKVKQLHEIRATLAQAIAMIDGLIERQAVGDGLSGPAPLNHDLTHWRGIIDRCRGDGSERRDTGFFIAADKGSFESNRGTPVCHSPNAAFGKFLSRNAAALGITRVRANARRRDARGNRTSATLWRIHSR